MIVLRQIRIELQYQFHQSSVDFFVNERMSDIKLTLKLALELNKMKYVDSISNVQD